MAPFDGDDGTRMELGWKDLMSDIDAEHVEKMKALQADQKDKRGI